MSESGDVLERFADVLVQQISITHPEYLTAPFTVAEIYQDLVPYQSHRDRIGVEMNGDYEDALIRMLSGEGDCLLLDSEVAVREMREELTRSNPNTALFREFAALDVRLHPNRVPKGAPPVAEATDADSDEADAPGEEQIGIEADGIEDEADGIEDEADGIDEDANGIDAGAHGIDADTNGIDADTNGIHAAADEIMAESGTSDVDADESDPGTDETEVTGEARESDAIRETARSRAEAVGMRAERAETQAPEIVGHIEKATAGPSASVEGSLFGESGSARAEQGDPLRVCHWCREDLPTGDSVHFCPFCGSDLRPSPCRECGGAMEARWQFCVSCGADVRA